MLDDSAHRVEKVKGDIQTTEQSPTVRMYAQRMKTDAGHSSSY